MQGPRFFHQRYWGPHRTMHFKTRCITKIPFQMWQNTCPSPQIAKITGMPTDMLWENWGFCCWCCCKNSKDYSKHAYKQQHKTGVGQKQTKTTTIQYQKKTVDAKLLLCIGPLQWKHIHELGATQTVGVGHLRPAGCQQPIPAVLITVRTKWTLAHCQHLLIESGRQIIPKKLNEINTELTTCK